MPVPTRKILIIDDSPEDRETWMRYLRTDESVEYNCVECSSLAEAIEACKTQQPDCILLDYNLPDGDGVEFIQELGPLGGTQTFPVVMLTGTGSEAVAVNAMKAGAQDYLAKPRLNSEALVRTVSAAVYKAHADRVMARQRAELEAAYLEANEANARKDQFLAALSHELRTPLTAVLAAVSDPDLDQHGPEQMRQTFALVRRNVELEARLIDDLLDVTRISHGKMELRREPVDAHTLVEHAIGFLRGAAQERGVTLQTRLEAARSVVDGDPARLQQIWWNLLSNAIKFSNRGGAVRVESSNTPEGQLQVVVIDSGMGIPAETIGRIFDAFEQGDKQVTRQFGGLGLGLAICNALVEAHGGRIAASSAGAGQGSTFTVNLDATDKPALGSAPVTPPSPPPATASSAGRSVLLVEDHLDSAKVLTALMKRRGYSVTNAATVEEALAAFKESETDIVVSDIGLPDGSGLELIKTLRARRQIPCIVLSGYGAEDDLLESSNAAQAHLTKPVAWPQLDALMMKLLAGE